MAWVYNLFDLVIGCFGVKDAWFLILEFKNYVWFYNLLNDLSFRDA